ncbi:MAG: sulfatase family protein [Planctomycetota bacterium]|jgi:arylsulfatase A-like enzyme
MNNVNVVWFITDDTNHKMLGCYGGNVLSPAIDSIAENGVKFTNFYCASSACTPSRYNYLSGHYGSRCPAEKFSSADEELCNIFFNTHLDSKYEQSIGHAMQQAGYVTGFVGKWHVGGSAEDLAAMPVFEKDEDPLDSEVNQKMQQHQQWLTAMIRKNGFDYAESAVYGNHEKIPEKAKKHNLEWTAKGALDFIDKYKDSDKPFFLNMATTAIHGPDHAASLMANPQLTAGGYSDKHLGCLPERSSVYERIRSAEGMDFNSTTAGVLWMDDAFGAVIDRIKELGLEENTIFIWSTDHGFSGGKFSTYESGGRIPFLMQWKNHFPAGRETASLCQNIDLIPTLLDLINAEKPEGMVLDGKSMKPLLYDPDTDKEIRDDLYTEFGYTRSVRHGKWKYIAWRLPQGLLSKMESGEVDAMCTHFGRPIPNDRVGPTLMTPLILNMPHYFDADQLYDLEADPHEQKNLAEDPEYTEVLAEMKSRLGSYLKSFGRPFPLDDLNPFYNSEKFKDLCSRARGVLKKGDDDYWDLTRVGGFEDITREFYSMADTN